MGDAVERAKHAEPILEIDGLKTYFHTDSGLVKAVDGVTYDIRKGETLGVVGESGCGKSVTAMSVLRLIPIPPGEIVEGSVRFEGEELTDATEARMRGIRGNDIAVIFQEPMTSLNPVYTVGDQITEAIILHQRLSPEQARERAIRMLDKVGIPSPEKRIDEYPHQMSGGMRQRVMIAMALSCNPKLLVADEPTTALDVTIQAQILDLMKELQEKESMSILLITHDLGVVAEMAHRVVVMYAGKIVEKADIYDLFENPKHPYTVGLLHSIPKLDRREELQPIEGMVPDALEFPTGCKFHPRCPFAMEKCREEEPGLVDFADPDNPEEHLARCWYTEENPEFDYLAEPAPEPVAAAPDEADDDAAADEREGA